VAYSIATDRLNLIWVMPAQGAVTTDRRPLRAFDSEAPCIIDPGREPLPDIAIAGAVARLRERAPLVHNITNYVVMNLTANVLLAAGASPAMIHAEDEAAEFAALAKALVINIGTLSPSWVSAMYRAATSARAARVPWILDPVGVGATGYRTATATTLAGLAPTVIRGNASEILALAGEMGARPQGVDSTVKSEAARRAAKALAQRLGTVVAITGAIDYITDGQRIAGVANGDIMLTRVTGTGCSATALIGGYLGAGLAPFDAAVMGLLTIGIAGEIAAESTSAPGSFAVALIDAIYRMDDTTIARRQKLS
jgi:hydroxyethylthiazole kinase